MPVSGVEQKVSVANAYLMKNDMFQNYANGINIGRQRTVGGAEQLHHLTHRGRAEEEERRND